jgi:hypothetical protein
VKVGAGVGGWGQGGVKPLFAGDLECVMVAEEGLMGSAASVKLP